MTVSFTVILCDMLPNLVRAWRRAFAAYPEVEVRRGDLLEVEADAYVSPANSYGIMDGGIDAALSARFPCVETHVQAAIAAVGILLPVGRALVVETGDPDVPYLICAPTMEVPSHVGHTSNAFRAMLALLHAVEQFNAENEDVIESIAIPVRFCRGKRRMAHDPHARSSFQRKGKPLPVLNTTVAPSGEIAHVGLKLITALAVATMRCETMSRRFYHWFITGLSLISPLVRLYYPCYETRCSGRAYKAVTNGPTVQL